MNPDEIKKYQEMMEDRMRNHNVQGLSQFKNCMNTGNPTTENCYPDSTDDCNKQKILSAYRKRLDNTENETCKEKSWKDTIGGRRRKSRRKRTKKRRKSHRKRTKKRRKSRRKSKKRRRHRKR